MKESQKQNIKKLTKYTYDDIIRMSEIEFYRKITKLLVDRTLTSIQYRWLERQRLGDTTQQAMSLFDGEYKGKTY